MLKYIFLLLFCCASGFSQSIHDFAKNGDLQAIQALDIEDQEVFNLQNENGYSPLMLAAYYNKTDIILYLLKYGADVNAKDFRGNKALDYAILKQNETIIKLLNTYK